MRNRAILALPAALLLAASCGQSAAGPGGPSADEAGLEGGAGGGSSGATGATSGGGSGTSGGAASSSGAVVGGAESGTGSSGGADGGSSSSSGSSSGASGADAGVSACTPSAATCTCDNTGCNVGSYYLYDNQWNCGGSYHCGHESAYGCANPDGTVSWVVTSNQPAGNTAVLTYPAMQDNFSSKPKLSTFTAISATFEETSPHVGDYEVAWDCWFNGNANELMIWVDNYNQAPAGSKVASAVSLGGRAYDVWWSPSSGSGTGGYVVFYANATFTSGTVDLLQIFNYAASHGWLPTTSTVDQLSFGVEVCSTGGQDATWTVSNYSITAH